MNIPNDPPRDAIRNQISLWFLRVMTLILGLVAFGIGFACCCSGTGFAFLAMNAPEQVFLYLALGFGFVGGLTAFVFVVRRFWPKD
jgi:hypothetical protein